VINKEGKQMRPAIVFISIIFIVFTGCTITHDIVYSSSEREFYDDYNNSAGNKNVEVILKNDSTFYQENHTLIRNDSLYHFVKTEDEKYYELPTSSVKKINYLTNDFKTARLTFNDGDQLKGEDIFITRDSISFLGIREQTLKYAVSPVNNIKMISYKNHWKGVIPGLLAGILLGGVIGTTGWIYHPMDGGMTEQFDQASATIMGALTGLVIGPIAGYIIGFNINYQFSP
jgi:hypothetical protein